MSVNSIYTDLWPPTASRLQGLTGMQQCLPDDVHECLWIQEVTGEVWIGLEQNIISNAVNEWRKHHGASVRTMGWHFEQFCCRQLKNKIIWWNVSQCVKNVNKMCPCALFRLSNDTTLGKNVIFCWFCFPQVMQGQTLGEVGNWMIIWWLAVSEIFIPEIIKIWSFLFKLQLKMFRVFFETQCTASPNI